MRFPRKDSTEVLTEALSDIERLEQTIAELLTIARTATRSASELQLGDVFGTTTSDWRNRFAAAGRNLVVSDTRFTPTVVGTDSVLRHAIDVLLDNALVHGAGDVHLSHLVTSDHVTASVADHGPGFTHNPNQTTPGRLREHGFGLPLATRLIESLPGRLVIRSAAEHPRVDIVLRRSDPA